MKISTTLAIMATICVPAAATTTSQSNRHHPPQRQISQRSGDPTIGGHDRRMLYGIGNGGQPFRTTVTGGNAGGYTNRN